MVHANSHAAEPQAVIDCLDEQYGRILSIDMIERKDSAGGRDWLEFSERKQTSDIL